MGSNLKPCPFCGSNHLHSGHISAFSFAVECLNCGARGASHGLPDYSDKTIGELHADLQNAAIKSWNTRISNPSRRLEP